MGFAPQSGWRGAPARIASFPTRTKGATVSKIVIGVDASERSQDAIAFGGRLAAATGAKIVIAAPYHYSDVPTLMTSTLRDEARRTAESMRERLGRIDAEL